MQNGKYVLNVFIVQTRLQHQKKRRTKKNELLNDVDFSRVVRWVIEKTGKSTSIKLVVVIYIQKINKRR